MFGLELLGVAIGMVFIYLLLSLLCTACGEILEAMLKRRASDLARGIRELLRDPDGTGIAEKLYTHALVFGLYRGTYDASRTKNLPSYIPARTFALALMDVVWPVATRPPSTERAAALASLKNEIIKLENNHVRQALLPLVDAAGDNIEQARKNIESWYDSGMDRVSGGYTRNTKWIMFALGFLVAAILNVDTIAIAQRIANDSAVRESLVDISQAYVQASAPSWGIPGPDPTSAIAACQRDQSSPECRMAQNLGQLQQLSWLIGWDRTNPHSFPSFTTWGGLGAWLLKLLGWLGTAVAISLGAPFWFDVLNKFLVIRSTVKPTEKSPEEQSEDNAKQRR